MELFCGAELAFGGTYFAPRPSNVVKINTDLPVKTLITAEVPQSAGSFAHSECGLHNRFILWRADGSNLYLDEYALDRDLIDASLCINFSQSLIVPGTRLFIVRHKVFLLIVPTQSGIHRFHMHLARSKDDTLGNFSLLSRLHQSGELYANHDFHAWKFSGVATKASVGTDRSGLTVAAVCTMDRHLLRVVFPTLSPMNSAEVAEETTLQGDGALMKRFFAKPIADTWELAVLATGAGSEYSSAANAGGQRIFSLSRDGKIRAFDAHSSRVLLCVDIAQLVPRWSSQIVDVSMKAVPVGKGRADMLLLHMVVGGESHFVLLKQCNKDQLAVFFSTTLEDAYLKDFLCTVQQHQAGQGEGAEAAEEQEEFNLWAVVNEAPAESTLPENEEENGGQQQQQPYTLKRCKFAGKRGGAGCGGKPPPLWELVRSATAAGTFDSALFKFSADAEAIRNRVFDGNSYAFDVVQRAIQVVFKQPHKHFEYGSWLALNRHLDQFLGSGQFNQLYVAAVREDGDTLLDYGTLRDDAKQRKAYEKFWADFLKTCNQLQEESLKPLAIWHSAPTGLTGVIQICRFTVHCPPDAQLRSICEPSDEVAMQFFDLTRPSNRDNLKDPNNTMVLINNNSDELCRLIAEVAINLSPNRFPCKIFKCQSPFLNSNFTIGLAAMALRATLWARLKVASIISELNGVVPQILAIASEARVNPKLDMVISEYNCRIAQLINYYTTLWIALSVRLVSHEQPVPKQLNVAQAFLRSGHLVRRLAKPRSGKQAIEGLEENGGEDNGEEEEEEPEEEEEDDDLYGDELDELEMIEMLEHDRVHLPEYGDNFEIEEEFEGEEEQQEEDFDESSARPPPSRWDETATMLDIVREKSKPRGGAFSSLRQSQFSRFFLQLLDDVLWQLWPESHTLTLPRFLAEHRFFDALKNYCALNEPFPPELANAFRFFQAIALSGQQKPDAAWTIFQEVASKGIEAEDDMLNELLRCMYPSPSITLSEEQQMVETEGGGKRRRRKKKKIHSLVEYFNKVMFIFKEHKHVDYLVIAGKKAIKHAKKGDDDLLLSEVYTTLFTQYLLACQYQQALRTVLANPNGSRQSVCLRQLVTHLLDTKQSRVLVGLHFDELVDTVVDILETRCKAEAVTGAGGGQMYSIAYAFHISRYEYTKAAKLMYELATRLRHETHNLDLLQRRCDALATVYQTMQIDESDKGAFLVDVEQQDFPEERTTRRHVAQDNGVEGDFAMVELDEQELSDSLPLALPRRLQQRVELADVAREFLKVEARLSLTDADPMVLPPLADEDILRQSLKYKRYDMAWLLIKEFELPPYEVLAKITEQALRVDCESTEEEEDDDQKRGLMNESVVEPDWVLFNRNFVRDMSTTGGGGQKGHWRIVISHLDLAIQLFPHDTGLLRTVANTFLKFSIKLPAWLLQRYSRAHFGDLLRCLLDYGDLADAFKLLLGQIDVAKARVKELVVQHIRTDPMLKIAQEDVAQLLPYTHIETLLQMAEQSEERAQLPIAETLEKLKQFNDYQRSLMRTPAEA